MITKRIKVIMDEFNIMIPEGSESDFDRVWKDYDSWENIERNQVDVSDLFDSYEDDEDEDW
jgi:hypothetical protein|tara:strand:+ start:3082 stop:3264 length:183 start_codon:yes stop_codon:yes gene_type:complete